VILLHRRLMDRRVEYKPHTPGGTLHFWYNCGELSRLVSLETDLVDIVRDGERWLGCVAGMGGVWCDRGGWFSSEESGTSGAGYEVRDGLLLSVIL